MKKAIKKRFSTNTNEALAVLISSTKSKKRPVSLIEISKWVNIAVKKLGGYEVVADRLGLSKKMLRQFVLVTRLHPKVQSLFKRRTLDSIDAVVHLLFLSDKEQIIVANILSEKTIDTKDLRAIVQIRKNDSKTSIKSIVNSVIKTKTKKQYVVEFVIREGYSHAKLMNKFKKHINASEIIRLDVEGFFGRLVLTKKGKQELHRVAKKLNIRFQSIIPVILSK